MSYVLVKSGWTSDECVYHQPDPEDPDEPKCGYNIHSDIEWVRKDKAVIPNHRECKRCSGGVSQQHKGPELSAILSEMDPEAV